MPVLRFPEALCDQEGRSVSLRRERVPQGLHSHDQDRDGAQPLQADPVGNGVLAGGFVQERLFSPPATPRPWLPVQYRLVSASPRYGSNAGGRLGRSPFRRSALRWGWRGSGG